MIEQMQMPSLAEPENEAAQQPVKFTKQPAGRIKPTHWLWIPYIWFFFAATRTPSTWIWGEGQVSSGQDGNPADRWLMTGLILVGLAVLAFRTGKVSRILTKNKWLVVFLIYMSLSIVWSNFPEISLRRGIRSVGTFVMVMVVLTEPSAREAVRVILSRLYSVHIPLSVIAIKYFRSVGVTYNWSGIEEQWIGLSVDKNSLGQVAMCAGAFFVWQILQEWPRKKLTWNLPLLAMTLWILRGSKNIHSSTAILGFVFCVSLLALFQMMRHRAADVKRYLAVGGILAAFIVPVVYLSFMFFNTTPLQAVIRASGRDMTFTDRNLIWEDVLNNAAKRPVLGVGIGAYWVGEIGYDKYPMPNWSAKTPGWRPEEGHNGFIDVYAELGTIGEILLLVVIARATFGIFTEIERDFSYGTLRLAMFAAVILSNLTETSFLKGTHDLWFLFLLTAVSLPLVAKKVPAKKARFEAKNEMQVEEEIPSTKRIFSMTARQAVPRISN